MMQWKKVDADDAVLDKLEIDYRWPIGQTPRLPVSPQRLISVSSPMPHEISGSWNGLATRL